MLARVLAWIATAAGLTLIVVLVTGGIPVRGRPAPRLGARRRAAAPADGRCAGAALKWRGAARARRRARRRSRPARSRVTHRRSRIVGAAAIAGMGVGFGTFAASSADPSGYVSHAVLIDNGRLTIDEPLARAVGLARGDVDVHPAGLSAGAYGRNDCPRIPARPAAGHGGRAPADRRDRSVSGRARARGAGRAGHLRDDRAVGGAARRRDCRRAPRLEPDCAVPDRAADERRPGYGVVGGGGGVRDATNGRGLGRRRRCLRAWRC